jgi:COP9 signalosome complex subunit 3
VCLQTGHLSAAHPVLDNPVSQLGPDLTYNDNLLFHYTGGMILTCLKRWKEAEDWFEICVNAPAHQPAALQMEALKKLICVQLISKGKVKAKSKNWSHFYLIFVIHAL